MFVSFAQTEKAEDEEGGKNIARQRRVSGEGLRLRVWKLTLFHFHGVVGLLVYLHKECCLVYFLVDTEI